MSRLIDLSGQRFGRLFVLERTGTSKDGHVLWLCKCDCDCDGKVIVESSNLKSSRTKSCGCLVTKHGHNLKNKKSKIYQSWDSMIQRCTNTNNTSYCNYGGRGITVCKKWLKFENFLEDMGKGCKPGLTLERKKNWKGYCLGNCYWATWKQQARNKRNNHLETYNGKTQCIAQWAEEYKINYHTLCNRIHQYGWSIEKALTTSVRKRRGKKKC